MTRYYKLHQRGDVWNYIKFLDDRLPVAAEIISFFQEVPHIYFEEYNLFDPSAAIEYRSLNTLATLAARIHQTEYEAAYELVLKGEFEVYINGQKQSID